MTNRVSNALIWFWFPKNISNNLFQLHGIVKNKNKKFGMKRIALILCIIPALVNTACRSDGNKTQPLEFASAKRNGDSMPVPVMAGNDADSKGCKGSAGYVWSVLRKECIRPWENGIAFLKTKKGLTTAAYLLLSADKRSAELFCPELKTSSLLSVSNKKTEKGLHSLYEDVANRWALVNDAGKYLLQNNEETLYRLPDSSLTARTALAAIVR